MRYATLALGIALGALALTFVAGFVFADMPTLLSLSHDGGGYYLQVARNIAQGHGSTFDQTTPTNGFHPLWMALLVVLFRITSFGSELSYRVVGVIDVGLLVLAACLLQRTLRALLSPPAALAGVAVFAMAVLNQVNLMESALLLAVMSGLLAFAWHYQVYQRYRPGTAAGFGLLLGLTILARLDTAVLALVIGCVDLLRIVRKREQVREDVARLAWIVAGSSLLVLPFFAYNHLEFASIMPISGQIERVPFRTDIGELIGILREMGKPLLLPLLGAAAFLGWFVALHRGAGRSEGELFLRRVTAVLALACGLHALNEIFFVRWQLYWHFAPLNLLLALLVAIAWQGVARRFERKSWQLGGIVLLGAAVALFAVRSVVRLNQPLADRYRASYQTALWLRAQTEPGARLAMESPEVIGYFSERPTVDLSGLCNGLEFQRAVREQQLGAYLAQQRVHYLVRLYVPLPWPDAGAADAFYSPETDAGTMRIKSDLFEQLSEPLQVQRSDEVYRSDPYQEWHSPQDVVVAVWRRAAPAEHSSEAD